MNAFKLKYKKNGICQIGKVTVTNWTTEQQARSWYNQLKEDSTCEWCELIYNPGDEDYIMDEFVR